MQRRRQWAAAAAAGAGFSDYESYIWQACSAGSSGASVGPGESGGGRGEGSDVGVAVRWVGIAVCDGVGAGEALGAGGRAEAGGAEGGERQLTRDPDGELAVVASDLIRCRRRRQRIRAMPPLGDPSRQTGQLWCYGRRPPKPAAVLPAADNNRLRWQILFADGFRFLCHVVSEVLAYPRCLNRPWLALLKSKL